MPLIHMKEIFTPLSFIGIKFFRSKEGQIFIKMGKQPRKRIWSGKSDLVK
ncbi:hypothetical protein M3182_05615 [Mesobacillus maritimus]|nr:hypothetical protein [Mesobacillus maritimus]MCM3585219.1 hypothetical protein [Mesobacillus maritimus]MCM3668110.1 hypothetical protein [Mesobacillus maritimus]